MLIIIIISIIVFIIVIFIFIVMAMIFLVAVILMLVFVMLVRSTFGCEHGHPKDGPPGARGPPASLLRPAAWGGGLQVLQKSENGENH